MPEVNKKGDGSTFAEVLLGLLALVCVAAVVKVALWAWHLLMRIINFIGDAVSLLGQVLIVIGLLVLAAFIIAAVLDALAPLAERLRKRRNVHAAISRISLPKISTFRGAPAVNQLDQWLASEVLGPRFMDISGMCPRETSFRRHEADFALFRAKELPGALLGPFRIVTEQTIFTPIYEAYRGGDEKVVKWTDDAITAVRKRHPLRLMGRVLRLVTFKFGFRAGEGFTRETIEDRGTDRSFIFNEILWLHFWPNASLICSWVEMDFALPEKMETLLTRPKDERKIEESETAHPMPLLPAPSSSSDASIIDIEAETRKQRLEEEKAERQRQDELIDEAVSSVKFVVERWRRDDPAFDFPEDVLKEDEEILLAARPFHPDSELVFEQIALNQLRKERLKTFGADFEKEMNLTSGEDAPFSAPWLAAAVCELDGEITPNRFERLALRNYLLQIPSEAPENLTSATQVQKVPKEESSRVSSDKPDRKTEPKTAPNEQRLPNAVPAMFIPDGL